MMKFNIVESIEDKGIFKAIFMAGSPGAGKSYVLSKISDGYLSPKIVNTDKFIEFLGNWKMSKGIIDRAKTLTQEQLYHYLNGVLPLFVDATSSHATNVIKRNGILQSLGYDTGMIFVNTSLETALKRIGQRQRAVDKDWAEEVFEKITSSKEYYKGNFSFFYEINNEEGELTDEVIMQAYKKVKQFYLSPTTNPEGQATQNQMKKNGWKYLTDGAYQEAYLRKLISIWYLS